MRSSWKSVMARILAVGAGIILSGCGTNVGGSTAPSNVPAVAVQANEGVPSPADEDVQVYPRYILHVPSETERSTRGTSVLGFTPAQIRGAYGFNQINATGTGATIAIVDAYGSPSLSKDVAAFCQQFSLPGATVTTAFPSGQPSGSNAGWALETALDVEWAHAMAPGAKILVVVARSAGLTDMLAAVDYAGKNASVVSMSWGIGEFSAVTTLDSHFAAKGVTYFAAAGDSGAGVLWPAVSSNVTAVGGTHLTINGSAITESAWTGSGGGTSGFVKQPAYQSSAQKTGMRTVPDVAYDADPATGFAVYDSTAVNGYSGWLQVGGTSAGTPQWAALMALANSQRNAPLGQDNPALYSFGSPSKAYRDITKGNDGANFAGTGYDEVTGLGCPLANVLVPGLASSH